MSTPAAEAEAARFARRRLRLSVAIFPEVRGALCAILLIALLIGVAAAARQLTRPSPPVELRNGDAVVTSSGEVFVIDNAIAYPAANPVSARLASQRLVHADIERLSDYPRGQTRGIPGAPATVPSAAQLTGSTWQLCTINGSGAITLSFGSASYLSPAAGEQVLLDDGLDVWVVRDGVRLPAPPASRSTAIATIPELTSLIPVADDTASSPVDSLPGGHVVCAQSDPSAPFARPSVAAVKRGEGTHKGVAVTGPNGTVTVSMRPGAGVLAKASEGGYWLLTSSGELNRIVDDQALQRLGLSQKSAVSLPESLLGLLPAGPALSIADARRPVTASLGG